MIRAPVTVVARRRYPRVLMAGLNWPTAKHLIYAAIERTLVNWHQLRHRIHCLPDRCWIVGGAHHKGRREDPSVNKFLQDQRAKGLAGLSRAVPGYVNQVTVPAPKLEIRA